MSSEEKTETVSKPKGFMTHIVSILTHLAKEAYHSLDQTDHIANSLIRKKGYRPLRGTNWYIFWGLNMSRNRWETSSVHIILGSVNSIESVTSLQFIEDTWTHFKGGLFTKCNIHIICDNPIHKMKFSPCNCDSVIGVNIEWDTNLHPTCPYSLEDIEPFREGSDTRFFANHN